MLRRIDVQLLPSRLRSYGTIATVDIVVPIRPTWRWAASLQEPLTKDAIALIADLHGNIPALEAVLSDIVICRSRVQPLQKSRAISG